MKRPLLWIVLAFSSALVTHRGLAAAFPRHALAAPMAGGDAAETPPPDTRPTPTPALRPTPGAPPVAPGPTPRALTWADPAPNSTFDPSTGLPTRVIGHAQAVELVLVLPGAYERGFGQGDRQLLMGRRLGLDTRREEPAHNVTLTKPFYLACKEVTQGQWFSVTGVNPANNDVGDDYPIENVSVDAVKEFLAETGYRLPTEAEWEFACRAGEAPLLYASDAPERALSAVAWHRGNSGQRSKPIGSRAPNALGLYDMYGNVSELCSDLWYDAMYVECLELGATDPTGPERGRNWVVRGSNFDESFEHCRPSLRREVGGGHDWRQGVRVAHDP